MKNDAANRPPARLSIVIPVFNEEANLESLHRGVVGVLKRLDADYEMIFVDDGSTDRSVDVLKTLRAADENVKVLCFSRNFGHQIALTAGLDAASGDAAISIDADLEHPPEIIAELVAKWREGFEVVYTVRTYPPGVGWFKRKSSDLFYRLLQRFAEINITPAGADFRLLDRRALNWLKAIRERDRFLRGLVSWIGFRQAGVPFTARVRAGGESKYSFLRMVRLGLSGLTSFSSLPLQAATLLGFVVSIASFLYAMMTVYWFFTGRTVPGWASLSVLILFLGGVQLICMGVMGTYMGKIYNEVKCRPLYVVRDAFGLPFPAGDHSH